MRRVDNDGLTPLHNAVDMDRLEVAEFLLAQGALADTKDYRGISPLDAAQASGNAALLAAVKAALEKEAAAKVDL